jgi:phospholipid/cholesterol/gamma-HCH transport system substrate-binding protein
MTERTRNIAVGVTSVFALAGFAVTLMMFGYVPQFVQEGYKVRVRLANAAGLSEGSRVSLSGIEVGRITSVQFDPDRPGGVIATALIKRGINVPNDVVARATATLLGSGASLDLTGPQPVAGAATASAGYLSTDGQAEIEGESSTLASDIQASLQRLEVKFGQVSADLTHVATSMSTDFHDLSTQWTAVGRNVQDLTQPRTPEQVDAGKVVGNLSSVLARTDSRLRELHGVLDGINQWVADAELRGNVQKTAANTAAMTAQIQSLVTKYVAVADDLSGAVASMRTALDRANQGVGTVGKLLTDSGLYNSLNDSAVRLGQAIDEVKALLEKVRKEGLPLKY